MATIILNRSPSIICISLSHSIVTDTHHPFIFLVYNYVDPEDRDAIFREIRRVKAGESNGFTLDPVSYTHLDVYKRQIYLYTLSQSVYTENFVASFSRSMVTSRSIIGGVTFA